MCYNPREVIWRKVCDSLTAFNRRLVQGRTSLLTRQAELCHFGASAQALPAVREHSPPASCVIGSFSSFKFSCDVITSEGPSLTTLSQVDITHISVQIIPYFSSPSQNYCFLFSLRWNAEILCALSHLCFQMFNFLPPYQHSYISIKNQEIEYHIQLALRAQEKMSSCLQKEGYLFSLNK